MMRTPRTHYLPPNGRNLTSNLRRWCMQACMHEVVFTAGCLQGTPCHCRGTSVDALKQALHCTLALVFVTAHPQSTGVPGLWQCVVRPV
jgi:hypothetical protein